MPANFPRVSLARDKPLPSPELALSYCRTRGEAGWGGQQVLFLKHIWESSIKRGGKSTKPEKEVFILQAGLSPALPLDGKHFQRVPRQHRALWPTALESAKARTQNLAHSGVRTQHLYQPQAAPFSPDLCQLSLLLVKYSKTPTCQPSETPQTWQDKMPGSGTGG